MSDAIDEFDLDAIEAGARREAPDGGTRASQFFAAVKVLKRDLSASRRESAALSAMVARLRSTIESIHAGSGEADWIYKACDRALALTPATVGAEYEALVELEHAIGEVRRHWGSAVGATDGQRAVIDALAKLESTRALLSDRAPGKGNDK